ncbi:diguanylate cyclase [Lichenihabitans sp. Uapishka_5]|uniref:GGDEF domain-containing protein n=1 Tax=Lichenihabitans sp. Uapishka_5 TaxID=3037302 RepID=UPI0029E7FF98|nr:diguanylate cyclase [Lichenihabitans sp. Uapishka_5]MDX7950561.1 diguanylate cyclase [Lichenihabitans sp. Uapishka_5]
MLNQVTIDKLADPIIWLDEDARYVFVNPAATHLLGYTAEELCRLRVWDIDPAFDEARWRRHWVEILERKTFKIETVNRSKSGRDIPIEVTVNLVEYEDHRFNCSIVRDISERRRIEADLRDLHDRIYQLSVTDALTGLANRRHFDLALADEIARHVASRESLSLILIDVDAFKPFNDTYGHVAGDDVLGRVADSLRSVALDAQGTIARYGGEEFVCILPGTGGPAAFAVAERYRHAIEALGIVHNSSPIANHVTASVGVMTTLCEGATQASDLLRRVDVALYSAKRQGRNTTAVATDTTAMREPL